MFKGCEEKTVKVHGTSMSPLIKNGASINAVMGGKECISPLLINDIILFNNGSHSIPLIKRIYAKEGDKFTIKDGVILINQKPATNSQSQPYNINKKRATMLQLYIRDYNGIIPAHTFLVLGDNTGGTDDSSRFGLIHENDIIGKVVF